MKNFIKSLPNGEVQDWEIVTLKIRDIKDPALFDAEYELSKVNKPANKKMEILVNLVKEGKPFPPIIVSENNDLRDGTHRLAIYKLLGRKTLKVLRTRGKGTGKVKGKYPGHSTYPYKYITSDGFHLCIDCKQKVNYLPSGSTAGPVVNFPHGLPSGPLWYCYHCGYNFNRNFVVWKK